MLIDWFTVAAQVINFLILLWLLKHFLFDRIENAVKQREKDIRKQFEDVEKKNKSAEKKETDYKQKKQELEDSRDAEMKKAREAAQEERESMINDAREESEKLRRQWRASLDKEKKAFYREFRVMAVKRVGHAVQKALSDLANAGVEKQAVKVFLDRFKGMAHEELPGKNGKPPRVRTGFDLPEDLRKEVQQAVSERCPDFSGLEFEKAPELFFGIELIAGGKRIAWNLKEYTDTLEKRFLEKMESRPNESEKS